MENNNNFDKLMREHEIKNDAANVIKTTQKIIDEFAETLEMNDKLLLEGAISELKKVLIDNNIELIPEKTEILKNVALTVSDHIYNGHVDNSEQYKSEDLEKTKNFSLNNKDNNNDNNKSSKTNDNKSSQENVNNKDLKDKKKKEKNKTKFKDLPKNKKIKRILLIIIPILIVIICLICLIFLRKDEILQEDNYYYKNGVLYFKNSNGIEIGKYKCQNKLKKICMVAYEFNDDIFDHDKKITSDNKEYKVRSKIYYDRYVFIKDSKDKKIILYDIKKNKKIKNYYGIKSYKINKKNYVIVKNNKNKEFILEINKDKTKDTDKKYNYLGVKSYNDNIRYISKNNDIYNILDENYISTFESKNEIKDLNDNYVVLKDSLYKIVDYKNKDLATEYDYLKIYKDFYVGIKNNILNVYNYNNNKLIPDDINVYNKYYNKIDVVKNNKIIETKKCFDIVVKNSELFINIYNKNKKEENKYDLNELLLNSKLEYYSYSNNKIYIYKEKEKKQVLGTYKCNNKNVISKDTTKLNNCSIYNKNNLKEHVFSNRYTFIKDGDSIILYDILTKKNLKTYTDVNFDTINDFYVFDNIYVKVFDNKKVGLIKILKSNVENLIETNYDMLDVINDSYVKVKKDNQYQLLNLNGKLLKANFNKNAYTIKNNSSAYEIYSFDDNKQISGVFTYVKFYDKYIACVTSNNILLLYNYKFDRLIDGVGVSSKTSFDITDSGNITIISTGYNNFKYNNSINPFTKIEDKNEEKDNNENE